MSANSVYKSTTTYRNLLRGEEARPHKVCTVWPMTIIRPHPAFGTDVTIPGAPGPGGTPQPGATSTRYGFAMCPPGVNRDDLGEGRTLAVRELTAKRIAMDVIGLAEAGYDDAPRADGTLAIVAPAITTSDLFEKGYFVPEGDDPTEEELSAAERRRDKWLNEQLKKGDNVWNSTGRTDRIPPDAIVAARFLGQNRDWAPRFQDARSRVEILCPVCRKTIEQGVRKCVSCNEWLGYEEDGTPYAVNDPERKARAEKADAGAKARAVAAKLEGKE